MSYIFAKFGEIPSKFRESNYYETTEKNQYRHFKQNSIDLNTYEIKFFPKINQTNRAVAHKSK